jgi:hypothetical protein
MSGDDGHVSLADGSARHWYGRSDKRVELWQLESRNKEVCFVGCPTAPTSRILGLVPLCRAGRDRNRGCQRSLPCCRRHLWEFRGPVNRSLSVSHDGPDRRESLTLRIRSSSRSQKDRIWPTRKQLAVPLKPKTTGNVMVIFVPINVIFLRFSTRFPPCVALHRIAGGLSYDRSRPDRAPKILPPSDVARVAPLSYPTTAFSPPSRLPTSPKA